MMAEAVKVTVFWDVTCYNLLNYVRTFWRNLLRLLNSEKKTCLLMMSTAMTGAYIQSVPFVVSLNTTAVTECPGGCGLPMR
jgi:hypothetical protein